MSDQLHRRRRATDRAEERVRQAERLGDRAALLMATAKAEAAHRRRAEWVAIEADRH